MIRKLLGLFAPITVIVDWEDIIVKHKTWSRAEALEWCACYDVSAIVRFEGRFGRIQGYRF